jgi:TIR domain
LTADYTYDVFISYKHDQPELITPWLRKVVARVELWLGEELGGRTPRVFFDKRNIGVGSVWPRELREALASTRCLVPVWAPGYFRSPWCIAEWRSFVTRQKMVDPRHRLIVPLTYHDGQWFPPEAQATQQRNVSKYAATTDAFWSSTRADELDEILKDFAAEVAAAVLDAPPFDPGWPVVTPPPYQPPNSTEMRRL